MADVSGQVGNACVGILDDFREARDVADPLWGNMAELVEMRAQRVHGLGALLHELFPRPECDGTCPLIGRFRFDEPHRRPQRRFADRLGIRRVDFLPLDERLDVLRRDQPDLVPVA